MGQPENSSRPWWKKIAQIWSSENSQAEQMPTPSSELPHLEVTPPCDHDLKSEAVEMDASRSSSSMNGMTQYERFQRRMAKREQELLRRKSKTLNKDLTRKERDKRKRSADAKRLGLLREHKEALRLKKMQCRNTWGRLESAEWNRVLEQFLRTVLRVSLDDWPRWKKQINAIVGAAPLKRTKLNRTSLGSAFEFQIAAHLRSLGWSVQLLGKSGDQGGDLLAQKGEKNVVVQCKNHAGKVGNAAVQEVAAARQFYQVSTAVVVCGHGFTRQAQALADKTTVLLLTPDQLSVLG